MDNYYNTRTNWKESQPVSANGTFYTDLSAAKEILNSEKKHLKTAYKKRNRADPEINIKDEEIKAMFAI